MIYFLQSPKFVRHQRSHFERMRKSSGVILQLIEIVYLLVTMNNMEKHDKIWFRIVVLAYDTSSAMPKPGKFEYLICLCFCDFPIWNWNCSDCVVFLFFIVYCIITDLSGDILCVNWIRCENHNRDQRLRPLYSQKPIGISIL